MRVTKQITNKQLSSNNKQFRIIKHFQLVERFQGGPRVLGNRKEVAGDIFEALALNLLLNLHHLLLYMSARFGLAIDARIASILSSSDPPINSSSTDAADQVLAALKNRHKEYRSKPPESFARVVRAALQRVMSQLSTEVELDVAPSSDVADACPSGVISVQAASLNAGLYPPVAVAPPSPSPDDNTGGGITGSKRRRADPTRTSKRSSDGSLEGGGTAGGLAAVDGGFVLLPCVRPWERYSDLGGVRPLLRVLRELVEFPLVHPELFYHLGIDPPTGILLYGSSGCGKTRLARAIGGELGVYFRQVCTARLSCRHCNATA